MSDLPETGLAGLTKAAHETHHQKLHDFDNKLLLDALIGDTLVKTVTGTTVASVAPTQPHFVHANQVLQVSHTVAGILTIPCTRTTRAVRVTASANITGITVTGMDLIGPSFARVHVRVGATAAISLVATGTATVIGAPPSALTSGQVTAFELQRWA